MTEQSVGTRFAMALFRTFVDASNPENFAAIHAAQDAIKVSGGGDGLFEALDWNLDSLAVTRKALNDLAAMPRAEILDGRWSFPAMDPTE
ncbi:hypothetical protein [Aliiruegeria sabulilitoris]|uniref:hypothetical protein n=1 Tax=Aliiruegeria sabulilitoris TaxID=1510458 RepID=UPI0008344F9B|nr:hypothetical protein [Aliiruegeria sabulilitoris]NDR58878.1 DUF1254 domain-containing protein [Pseudoruegeria sp. M32A2M]